MPPMRGGYSIRWYKQVTCTRNEWQQVYQAIRHMDAGSDFTLEAARRCNQALHAPILCEPGVAGEADTLVDDPHQVNSRLADVSVPMVTFTIESKVYLRIEMVRATVRAGSAGHFAFLGPAVCKGGSAPSIPPYVPDASCLDASDALGMWFAKAQLPPNELVNSPGPGHMLRAQEIVWFRFNRRRFWAPMLCVSPQVADSGKLVENDYLIAKALKDNQQYLLLPALNRRSGDVADEYVSLRRFVDEHDLTETKMKAVHACLFGDEEEELRLDAHDVIAPDVMSGDFLIGGENAKTEIATGLLPSGDDAHGVIAQPHYAEAENALNLRRNIGQNLAAVLHVQTPPVYNLPSPTQNSSTKFWECPPSRRTLINEESKLLFLKTSPTEYEIQMFERSQERKDDSPANDPVEATAPAQDVLTLETSLPLETSTPTVWPETPMMPQFIPPGMPPWMSGMPPLPGMPMTGMPAMAGVSQWNFPSPPPAPLLNGTTDGSRTRSKSRGRNEATANAPEYSPMAMFGSGFGLPWGAPPMQWPGAQQASPTAQGNRDRSGSCRRLNAALKKDQKAGKRRGKSPSAAKNAANACIGLKEYWQDDKAFQQTKGLESVINNGEIADFARDHRGQRFLINQLQRPQEKEKLFEALLESNQVASLSLDDPGYKLIKRLLVDGDAEQKKKMTAQLHGRVHQLSNDKHGCWVIQQAVEKTQPAVASELVNELRQSTIHCVKDLNGNHVVQKVIEVLPQSDWNFILEAVENYAEQLSTHKCGCRVVLRLIEYAKEDTMGPLLDRIGKHIPKLSKDQYGNYVVQHILEHGRPEDIRGIMKVIQDDILLFAKDMCSSHVVEKCLTVSSTGKHSMALAEDRQAFMRAVLSGNTVKELRSDRFGPFIVQTLKTYCNDAEQKELEKRLSHAGSRHR